MRIPPAHTMAFARLLVIHELGSATQEQMKIGTGRNAVSHADVRAWIERNLESGVLTQDGDRYSVVDEIKVQLDDYIQAHQPVSGLVPHREVNIWTPPMTGYDAEMRRRMARP